MLPELSVMRCWGSALREPHAMRTFDTGTYVRLSVMMFIQYAIWGAWVVLIAGHMNNLQFNGRQISYVFGTTAFGALISPLIAGWVADRYLPAQIFTAACHFVGAILLAIAWFQRSFGALWQAILLYAVLYMPTLALTNAIAFHHLPDARTFGQVRVWGTLGWIAIQWASAGYLAIWERWAPGVSRAGDCLAIAAALSLLMSLYCFSLPNTPPARQAKNPYAFLEAFALCRNPNFAVLLVISFVVAIELPFYYNFTFIFLTDAVSGVGLSESWATFAMSLGQVAEVLLMLLVAPSLRHLGMRNTIVLGILAWPVRYGIFAIGQPAWLVIAAQSLHGICYAFFFVAGMIAVERLSHRDVRASAQSLVLFATNGVGMLLGSLISGRVVDFFVAPNGGHRWAMIYLVPIAVTLLAAGVFRFAFSERDFVAQSDAIEREDAGN